MSGNKPTPVQKRAILAAIDNGGRTSSDPYQLRTITALLRFGWMTEPDGRTLEVTDAGREAIQSTPNLNEAMTKALIELSMGNVIAGGPTLAALRRRGLVALIDRSGRDKRTVRLTKAGREAVTPILKAREEAEQKAAPWGYVVHAFGRDPKAASSAAACGGQGWRGPVDTVTCRPCREVLVRCERVTPVEFPVNPEVVNGEFLETSGPR